MGQKAPALSAGNASQQRENKPPLVGSDAQLAQAGKDDLVSGL